MEIARHDVIAKELEARHWRVVAHRNRQDRNIAEYLELELELPYT